MLRARWLMALSLTLLLLFAAGVPASAAAEPTQVANLARVKAIAAAGDHYVALRADGTVWTWTPAAPVPQQVQTSGCGLVRAVIPGGNILSMICADGSVWTAGFGISEPGMKRADKVQGLDSIKAVALGRPGLFALRTDGTVLFAEIAIDESGVHRAVPVPDLSGVVAIAAGITDAMAIKADGTAWRLAVNTKGTSAKREPDLPPVRAVAACGGDDDCDDTDAYLFTTADGRVLARAPMGDGSVKTLAIGDLDGDGALDVAHGRILSLRANGDARTALLTPDGRVIVNDIKRKNTRFKQLAGGHTYDMGLGADGTVWLWDAPSRPTQVTGLPEITAISSAGEWNLALAADGRLFCWGSNDANRTHVIPHVLEVRHIVATPDFYLLLLTDGTVATGLWPAPGALPAEPIVHRDLAARSVAGGPRGHVILIKFDGRISYSQLEITAAGPRFNGFTEVTGLDSVGQVASGTNGYLALRADGTVWASRWGGKPERVQGISGGLAIAGFGDSFGVVLGDGTAAGIAIDESGVHIWGDPHVDEADGSIAVGGGGSGGSWAAVTRADGTVATFARTVGAGQVTEILDGIAVSTGAEENLVLMADGSVWRWRQ